MREQPFCSVIVLNFNGKRYLDTCFKSLRKTNYPKSRYEVIMVDNGSTDSSVKLVKNRFPWVKILSLDKNYGFAEGNNKGIEKTRGGYIVFLNNDTEVDTDWLSELVKTAVQNPKIGICGSKIIDQKLDAVVGEGYLNPFGIPKVRSKHDTDKECFFVSGASLLIKRLILRKLSYCFDRNFFVYFEDVDLCWRVRLLGYKVFYVPRSIVFHKGSGTASKKSTKKSSVKKLDTMKFYHYRNKIWTFKKNLRFPLTQLLMVPVSVTTLFMILYWVSKNQWNQGIGVLKYIFSKVEKTPGLKLISLKDQLKLFFI